MSALDEAVDAAFEPLRGRPGGTAPPRWSRTWPTTGSSGSPSPGLKARRRGPDRRRAVVALAAAGFSSLLVSRVVKAAVERQRPDDHLDAGVRTPSSSSFPSGHTLAAFCTAFVLADSDARTVANVGFATAVAASRVHLRAHHPTDVIGRRGHRLGARPGAPPDCDLVTPGSEGHPPAGRPRAADGECASTRSC